MARTAQQILDDALQLVPDERDWLAEQLLIGLNKEAFSALKKEYGEPEAGYEAWFRAGVEEALADNSEGVPHEKAMKQLHHNIQSKRKLKQSA
jgi:DNA polymerase III psi subunit